MNYEAQDLRKKPVLQVMLSWRLLNIGLQATQVMVVLDTSGSPNKRSSVKYSYIVLQTEELAPMLVSSIIKFLLIYGGILFTTAVIYNAVYPLYKIKQIKQQVVLKCDFTTFVFDRYSWQDLPLGELGIVTGRVRLDSFSSSYYNSYKAEIVIPVLTEHGKLIFHSAKCTIAKEPSGIARAIFLGLLQASRIKIDNNWYGEKDVYSVSIPVSDKLDFVEKARYRVAQELAPLIKERHELELEIMRIDSERRKAKRLLNLVSTSDAYANQQNIYETFYSEISRLLSKAQELEQLYRHFIREALIGVQLVTNHPAMSLRNHLSIKTMEAKCEKQKDEYQYMKDKVEAYADLLNAQI